MATFDLNILPIHRQNGQDYADLPGLLAVTPPRKTARGRDKDNLILYLMLSGNAIPSPEDVKHIIGNAAKLFHQTAGSLTSAIRKTVENINTALHERNLSTTSHGHYAIGSVVAAVIRENQCTLSISGPGHVVWLSDGEQRHIFDPALSGKGLGSGQSIQTYLSQIEFHSNDLIALCGKFPKDWEADLLNERPSVSLDASYRKLTYTRADLNAVLIHPQTGSGTITVLRPDVGAPRTQPEPFGQTQGRPVPINPESIEPETIDESSSFVESPNAIIFDSQSIPLENQAIVDESVITEDELDALADMPAHMVQPSAYAIPPKPENTIPIDDTPVSVNPPTGPRTFPASIPRRPVEIAIFKEAADLEQNDLDANADDEAAMVESQPSSSQSDKPSAHAVATRQMAKVMVGGIKTGRGLSERFGIVMRNFIPKLMPGTESNQPLVIPTYIMVFMAVIIPVVVGVVAWIVYSKYGLSETFYALYQKALVTNSQYASETDPARQRDILNEVLAYLDQAEQYNVTDETQLLRTEAQTKLDNLMGVIRLEFFPAFPNGIGSTTQISRMAASESDLYMLDAERGNILHAYFTGRTLEPDSAFNCQPGTYGGYTAGMIVDLLALPKVNAIGANVMGIDPKGNLLYCSPGQVPQVIPLPPLPNVEWGRITAFTMDEGSLYVLDAESRAIWVYVGQDGSFIDPPYFFFENQIPDISSAIDIAVSRDDLYLLHADGHLTTCTFGRLDEVPTRCVDPAPLVDTFPAHRDVNVFAQAHFTQISITVPPNPTILLLDSENQSVFRFTPRSLEYQNQFQPYPGEANPLPPEPVGAMTISPNYVLYLAINNQVFFATNIP